MLQNTKTEQHLSIKCQFRVKTRKQNIKHNGGCWLYHDTRDLPMNHSLWLGPGHIASFFSFVSLINRVFSFVRNSKTATSLNKKHYSHFDSFCVLLRNTSVNGFVINCRGNSSKGLAMWLRPYCCKGRVSDFKLRLNQTTIGRPFGFDQDLVKAASVSTQ